MFNRVVTKATTTTFCFPRNFNRSLSSVPHPSWYTRLQHDNPLNLPRLVLPPLEKTLERYCQSLVPLVGSDSLEFKQHVALVADFAATVGPSLYQALARRDERDAITGTYPYSYIQRAWDRMYLGGRYPSPVNINPAYGLDITDGRDRCDRAAAFLLAMGKVATSLRKGILPVDGGCVATFATQFGATRVPDVNMDRLVVSHDSSHVAVLASNHRVYKLLLLTPDGHAVASEASLSHQLHAMVEASASATSTASLDVSCLTGDARDSWAANRATLQQSPHNQQTLAMIESAMCVLVLDERSVKGDASLAAALSLHGNGINRWFDKLQVISYADGEMGLNFEHSTSDGTVWNAWLSQLCQELHGTSSTPPLTTSPVRLAAAPHLPEEYTWQLNKSQEATIDAAVERLSHQVNNVDLNTQHFSSLSKNACKRWGASPDGMVQMAFQLASAYETAEEATHPSDVNNVSTLRPTYESCATRGFHHGRTETIRVATREALGFVTSAMSGVDSPTLQREKLRSAVTAHVTSAKKAQVGQGVDRVLLALNETAQELGVTHPFLSSDLKAYSSAFQLSSSNVTAPFLSYFAFGAVVPEGYGLGYLIQPEKLVLTTSSYKDCDRTDSRTFNKCLKRALSHIKQLQE